MSTIGERIRKLRKHYNLNQKGEIAYGYNRQKNFETTI